MKNLTKALTDFIHDENRSLLMWLLLLGLLSLAVAAVTAYVASSRVLAPLHQIKDAVRSVARGNWLVHIAGQRRKDEVGEIARAIVVLKRSVKERERLKADVADIEQVRKMRADLLNVTHAAQTNVRKSLFGISDLVEKFEKNGKKLASDTGLAEGESDEVRLTLMRVTQAKDGQSRETDLQKYWEVEGALDRLQETIGTLQSDSDAISQNALSIGKELDNASAVMREFLSKVKALENPVSEQLDAVLEKS